RLRPDEGGGRSEFTYGSFTRTLPLPDGADEDDVNAVYDRGILTVSVPLSDEHRVEKHIEVVEIVAIEQDDDMDDEDEQDDEDDEDTHRPSNGSAGDADQHEPAHLG
ncbi:heat-shock protein Hsp20, partial [Mycobacterium sp. ITM-2017-0098]